MNLAAIPAYELITERDVKELSSRGYLLKHKKSGAHVFLLENDDDNKVFSIGFRTPPPDSTGVPHIMEHSVLCGSDHFPVKDPFVELVKGSLNTFLNAMTYPDKTVYPVASCNDQDFKNLMHVYMDAVLHPNIYKHNEIFRQEGWHYELESPDGELTINGVVYNEMKGAFSSADDLLDREVYSALYPDTAYALESGGDPDVIPELTYEEFLDFHRRYYHPSNSYIYLYGDMDMEERLNWLDENYLCHYDAIVIDSALTMQTPFAETKRIVKPFSVTEDEPLENNTYLSQNMVIDTVLNEKLYLAFQILEYALLASPGAPLKEALTKAGIGEDIMSTYENGILQPYFSIIAKNANAEDEEAFLKTIHEVLSDIVKNGIDKVALEAGLHYYEFKYKEADFGSYPKGLMYGLQCYDSWLYDENDPFRHISAGDTIEWLKSQIHTGYFEKLIEDHLLNNPHSVVLILAPERGLTAKKDALLAEKLAKKKAEMSSEEIEALIYETKALKQYQQEPSSQEDLLSIPMLSISDIRKEATPFVNELVETEKIDVLFHDINTNGISYVNVMFPMKDFPDDLLPFAGLFRSIMILLSTQKYHYSQLLNEINRQSGGISTNINTYRKAYGTGEFKAFFEIEGKMLIAKTEFVFDMMREILLTSDLEDKERLREILQMMKARMQSSLASAGHSTASSRAKAYFSDSVWFADQLSGLDAYRMVEWILKDYDHRSDLLVSKLMQCKAFLLNTDGMFLDFTGNRDDLKLTAEKAFQLKQQIDSWQKENGAKWIEMYHQNTKKMPFEMKKRPSLIREECGPEVTKYWQNEGFKTSGQVQYVAVAGNFRHKGLPYTGALKVLRVLMGYDYLWIQVRVKGGAYGCMNNFEHTGDAAFVSYRDPNLKETLDVYRKASEYLENLELSDRDMTKYIIGTISDMDTPLTPKMKGIRSLCAYLCGTTMEMKQKTREEVLGCTVEDLRALVPYIRAVVDYGSLCVVGAEEKIKDNADLFDRVESLV